MKKKLLLLTLATLLSAKYTNCNFQNPHYTQVCQSVVKKGVSYDYANKFLLSYFKTQKFDEISWKYLQPSKLKLHQANEKKANNVLVSYLPQMVENLKKYAAAYKLAQERYGVNPEIIAAILLKETKLGKIKPTHDAFIVFNTMVVRTKGETPREQWLLKMGKTNMATIIDYCYKKKLKPHECNLPSSYAGAVGIAQFMPNSFIYADSYKSDIPELTNMEDAILSVASFLHKKADFSTPIEWEKMGSVERIEEAWYEYEFRHENASFVYESSSSGKLYNCFTKGKPELTYMKKYTKKIMRYNNSSNYAVGVIRLAYEAHKAFKP